MFASASTTRGDRACRVAITKAVGATKALAGLASHDVDGDRRHTAFNCSWFGYRDFLRFHAAISVEDAPFDRGSVDLSLQQARSRNRGHSARCLDLGDAGDLCCRIPVRLLDTEPTSGTADTLSPVRIARLRALACVFTGDLAYLLAGIHWLALRRGPVGNIYLFSYAFADQPRADGAKDGLRAQPLSHLHDPGFIGSFQKVLSVCESERAD